MLQIRNFISTFDKNCIKNSGRKRFKCKCSDGKCKWSINIEETICKGNLGFMSDFVL